MTPFEIFRKPVILYRKNAGVYINGMWQESSYFTFSAPLLATNVILTAVNSIPIPPVFFSVSSLNTMNLIGTSILNAVPEIKEFIISPDGLTLTLIAQQSSFVIINQVTVSGMSAPIATIFNSTVAIPITASVQPTSGEEMLSIPEGRRNKKSYALFTSTDVEVIHNGANPDLALIYGELYEVIRVEVWQNNPPVFGIVNHYKFIVSALEAIP